MHQFHIAAFANLDNAIIPNRHGVLRDANAVYLNSALTNQTTSFTLALG